MTNASRDNNSVPVIQGVLNTDGKTPTSVAVDPATHILQVSDDTTGSDNGGDRASRDENLETTLMGVSSSDGITPVAIYVDSSKNLLINST
jgi:hypothetical protein